MKASSHQARFAKADIACASDTRDREVPGIRRCCCEPLLVCSYPQGRTRQKMRGHA